MTAGFGRDGGGAVFRGETGAAVFFGGDFFGAGAGGGGTDPGAGCMTGGETATVGAGSGAVCLWRRTATPTTTTAAATMAAPVTTRGRSLMLPYSSPSAKRICAPPCSAARAPDPPVPPCPDFRYP